MWAYIGSPVLSSSPQPSARLPEVSLRRFGDVELRLRHRSQVICVARTCHFNVYRTALAAELQPLLRSYLRKTEMTRLSDAFEGGLAHGSLWRLRLTSAVIMQHSDNEYSVIMQHQRRRRDPRLDGRTCAALGRRHTPRERRQPSLSARARAVHRHHTHAYAYADAASSLNACARAVGTAGGVRVAPGCR